MSAPAKFLFDHDFKAAQKATPTVSLTDHAVKLKEAETAGYGRGFEAGKAETLKGAEQQLAVAVGRVAAMLEALTRGLTAVEAKLETEAVEVALAVAKKLSSALIEREPAVEITALATECFRQLVDAPHVVVRVNDAQHDEISKRLDEIARTRGLSSHLVVLADPDIPIGDCRIEWADGGINRNRDAVTAAIDEAVSRYVSGRLDVASKLENPWRFDR